MALDQRPDMASRLQEKKRADTETSLQRGDSITNITVGGGYKRNYFDNSYALGMTIP